MSAFTTSPTDSSRVLMRMRQSELDELFAQLPSPSPDDLDGAWQGRLMAITGLGFLPRALATGLWHVLGWPVNPWRGKAFHQGLGANQWFGAPGLSFGRYAVQAGVAQPDRQPCLHLNYNLPDNPFWLRPIRGEARQCGRGRLLCRMNWQSRRGLHRVLYFTLQQVH